MTVNCPATQGFDLRGRCFICGMARRIHEAPPRQEPSPDVARHIKNPRLRRQILAQEQDRMTNAQRARDWAAEDYKEKWRALR